MHLLITADWYKVIGYVLVPYFHRNGMEIWKQTNRSQLMIIQYNHKRHDVELTSWVLCNGDISEMIVVRWDLHLFNVMCYTRWMQIMHFSICRWCHGACLRGQDHPWMSWNSVSNDKLIFAKVHFGFGRPMVITTGFYMWKAVADKNFHEHINTISDFISVS